ncbi:hypothetical protein [Caulobacter sp. 17J80-11]|uniref:hypothetical protein n=1 Tax=Caulobacter sp. 17J80-11 TaxID=2763502 RepID=UPI001653B2FB|nr:hypothetical protein [Caulobacter sp. 17J80-11]MBC6981445.1 hypothetical protein [Caulobacter sp. 17J80-11]
MSLLVALGLLVVAQAEPAAAPAGPVTLLCKGSGTVVTADRVGPVGQSHYEYERETGDFTWQVTLDLERPSVVLNGKPLYVREVTDDEVTWSADKSQNLWTKAFPDTSYTIDRRTGALRFSGGGQSGSGVCEKAAQAKLL